MQQNEPFISTLFQGRVSAFFLKKLLFQTGIIQNYTEFLLLEKIHVAPKAFFRSFCIYYNLYAIIIYPCFIVSLQDLARSSVCAWEGSSSVQYDETFLHPMASSCTSFFYTILQVWVGVWAYGSKWGRVVCSGVGMGMGIS